MDIQKLIKAKYTLPILLTIVGFVYYFSMYARELTWIYTTSDSTDWLTQLRWWIVPHAFGKPLFVTLIHAVSYVPFGTDIDKVTIFLAVIPGAITIGITYLITLKLTSNQVKSVVAALVVLGAVTFTSQTTVPEQYAFMNMLLAIAIYFYVGDKKKSCAITLGLLTATHIMGLVITSLLTIALFATKKTEGWKLSAILYLVFGIVPYSLILVLMSRDNPNLLAGDLSVITVFEYLLGNPALGSQLALIMLPERLLQAVGLATLSFGLAIIPIFKAKGLRKDILLFFMLIIAFTGWAYLTNMFLSAWKYAILSISIIAVLAAIGLNNMSRKHTLIVAICAITLITTNFISFNSNQIAKERHLAVDYINFIEQLPDGSGVIVPRGGAYGFGVFYLMSKGKDIVPICMGGEIPNESYQDYLAWIRQTHDISGSNHEELATNLINKGYDVYFPTINPSPELLEGMELELVEPNNTIYKVISFNDR